MVEILYPDPKLLLSWIHILRLQQLPVSVQIVAIEKSTALSGQVAGIDCYLSSIFIPIVVSTTIVELDFAGLGKDELVPIEHCQ